MKILPIAAALNRLFDGVFRLEIDRGRCKDRTRRMFNALVHREEREIPAPAQPAVVEKLL